MSQPRPSPRLPKRSKIPYFEHRRQGGKEKDDFRAGGDAAELAGDDDGAPGGSSGTRTKRSAWGGGLRSAARMSA